MQRPSNETRPSAKLTPAQVRAAFEALLRERRDVGVRHFTADLLLEPRNPFQLADRRPKKWVVAVGALGILGLALVYAFHL